MDILYPSECIYSTEHSICVLHGYTLFCTIHSECIVQNVYVIYMYISVLPWYTWIHCIYAGIYQSYTFRVYRKNVVYVYYMCSIVCTIHSECIVQNISVLPWYTYM